MLDSLCFKCEKLKKCILKFTAENTLCEDIPENFGYPFLFDSLVFSPLICLSVAFHELWASKQE
jgi:hypothetical protein